MKEIQIHRKNYSRSSDPSNRRFTDTQLKNRKIAKGNSSSAFSDISSESTKDPVDSAQILEISEVISDCDAESLVQGSSPDLLFSPQRFGLSDLYPISTSTSVEGHMDVSFVDQLRLITDLHPDVRFLHIELNELKKLIDPNILPEDRDWIEEIVSMKVRVVFLCLLLWILVVAIIVFFGSGEQVSLVGPLPT